MTIDLSTASCELCACTETRACEGGCAWDPSFLVEDRAVCTRCATAVRAAEVIADDD